MILYTVIFAKLAVVECKFLQKPGLSGEHLQFVSLQQCSPDHLKLQNMQHNTTQVHIIKSIVFQSYEHDGLPMGGSVQLPCVVWGEVTKSEALPLPL